MIKISCMSVFYSQTKYYITKAIDLSPSDIFIFCRKFWVSLNFENAYS